MKRVFEEMANKVNEIVKNGGVATALYRLEDGQAVVRKGTHRATDKLVFVGVYNTEVDTYDVYADAEGALLERLRYEAYAKEIYGVKGMYNAAYRAYDEAIVSYYREDIYCKLIYSVTKGMPVKSVDAGEIKPIDGMSVEYYTNGDWIVTIEETANMYEAWFRHKDYGIAEQLIGCVKEQQTKEEFIEVAFDCLEGRTEDYEAAYC